MLILPIYYGALTAMTSSKHFRRWFPGRVRSLEDEFAPEQLSTSEGNMLESNKNQEPKLDTFSMKFRQGRIIAFVAPMVWSIIALSEMFEERSGTPGGGIAVISTMSFIASKVLSFFYQVDSRAEVRNVTKQLSDICYYMVLSVIGVSMNIGQLAFYGWWSSCSSLMFALVPLLVHFLVLLIGSMGMMHILPNLKFGIDQIAAASNAAICGPFTAAALVAKLSSGDSKNNRGSLDTKLKGLALAATFWGVVGYAIATNIGVAVCKALI